MDANALGKWIAVVGLGIVVLGLTIWLIGKAGLPLGRLPGDIVIRGQRWSFYFPVVSGIVISIVLTVILNVVLRLFRH
jgi:cytosine/uracil/thiamine/allantoin permease